MFAHLLRSSEIKRLAGYLLLVAPRAANVFLTLVIAPLFFKLWGAEYSFYVFVAALGGFASIVAQPTITRYYQSSVDRSSVSTALQAYALSYVVLVLPPLWIYLSSLNGSAEKLGAGLLFPLVTGGLLVARSSFYRFSQARFSAAVEVFFLVLKIPLGYLLATESIVPNVSGYVYYFAFCCLLEILVLARISAIRFERKFFENQPIASFFRGGYRPFFQVAGIGLAEVLFGCLDRILLTSYNRHDDLVLYSFSLTAATLLYVLPTQINAQSQAQYFLLKDAARAWNLIRKNSVDLTVVTVVPYVVFLMAGEGLTTLWLARVLSASSIREVYICACALMAGAVANSMCGPLSNYLQSRARFSDVFLSTAACVPAFFIGLVVAIRMEGIVYIGLAASLAHFLKFILILFAALKERDRERQTQIQFRHEM